MGALARSRALLWLLLALPMLAIAAQWLLLPDRYGAGHAIKDSGDWAAWLLLVTLAVSPLQLLRRRAAPVRWLAARRRELGLASFGYAAIHTAIYLWDKAPGRIVAEAGTPELLTGWLALLLFVPLALTSNDRAVRAMKARWKRLHQLVRPAAVLVVAHWALTAFDPAVAYLHIAILAAIEAARITLRRRQRVT